MLELLGAVVIGVCPAGWDSVGGEHRCYSLRLQGAPWSECIDGNAVFESESELSALSAVLPDNAEVWTDLRLNPTEGFLWNPASLSPYTPPQNTVINTRVDNAFACVTLSKNLLHGTTSNTLPFNLIARSCDTFSAGRVCLQDRHRLYIMEEQAVVGHSIEGVLNDVGDVAMISFLFGPNGSAMVAETETYQRDFGDVTKIIDKEDAIKIVPDSMVASTTAPAALINEKFLAVFEASLIGVYFVEARHNLSTPSLFGSLLFSWQWTTTWVHMVDFSKQHSYIFRRNVANITEIYIDGSLVMVNAPDQSPDIDWNNHRYSANPGLGEIQDLRVYSQDSVLFDEVDMLSISHPSVLNAEDTLVGHSECYYRAVKRAGGPLWVMHYKTVQHTVCRLYCLEEQFCVAVSWAIRSGGCVVVTSIRTSLDTMRVADIPLGDAVCEYVVAPTASSQIQTTVPIFLKNLRSAGEDPLRCANFTQFTQNAPEFCSPPLYEVNDVSECSSVYDNYLQCRRKASFDTGLAERVLTTAGCGVFAKENEWDSPVVAWTPHALCDKERWWLQYALPEGGADRIIATVHVVAPARQVAQNYSVYACGSHRAVLYANDVAREAGSLAEAETTRRKIELGYYNISNEISCVKVAVCGHEYDAEALLFRKAACTVGYAAPIIRVEVNDVDGPVGTLPTVLDIELEYAVNASVTDAPFDYSGSEDTGPATKVVAVIVGAFIIVLFIVGSAGHAAKIRVCKPQRVESEAGPTIPQGSTIVAGNVTVIPSPPNQVGGQQQGRVLSSVAEDAGDHRIRPSSRVQTRDLVLEEPTPTRRWRGPGAAVNAGDTDASTAQGLTSPTPTPTPPPDIAPVLDTTEEPKEKVEGEGTGEAEAGAEAEAESEVEKKQE